MKNLKYWLAAAFLGPASYSFAQQAPQGYAVDALRFSQTQPSGTARSLSIGGATVAVGADLGSLVTNPAGLGLYQRSEFSFTPGLGIGNTNSNYLGSAATDTRNSLHVASLGMVFVNRRPDSDSNPWRGGTLALGFNRLADYNQNFRYRGTAGPNQNILNRLGNDRETDLDDLAYEAYLTERDNQGTYVPSDYRQALQGNLTQEGTVQASGSQTQFDIGYGVSYRDKLYLGGGIGLVGVRYNSVTTLSATDPSAAAPNTPGTAFGSLSYRETLETRGSGVNARIGAIYRAADAVRVGISVQTPTYMQLSETYGSSLNATFDTPIQPGPGSQTYTSTSATTDPGEFDYVLTSPFRASGGVAVVVGKHGFLSGDVEYVNYSQARLSNNNFNNDFGFDNDDVRTLYQSAMNLRLGGELRFDIFRVRAGYARYGDAYKQSGYDRTQSYYTGGLGVRQNNFFLDVAGVYGASKRFYSPYTLESNTPVVGVDATRFTTTVTAGFLF